MHEKIFAFDLGRCAHLTSPQAANRQASKSICCFISMLIANCKHLLDTILKFHIEIVTVNRSASLESKSSWSRSELKNETWWQEKDFLLLCHKPNISSITPHAPIKICSYDTFENFETWSYQRFIWNEKWLFVNFSLTLMGAKFFEASRYNVFKVVIVVVVSFFISFHWSVFAIILKQKWTEIIVFCWRRIEWKHRELGNLILLSD